MREISGGSGVAGRLAWVGRGLKGAESRRFASVEIIVGLDAVLPALGPVIAAAAEWGQEASVSDLAYFLTMPGLTGTKPHLVLLRDDADAALRGAVMLVEYRGLLAGSRFFMTLDWRGCRNVFGPMEELARIAADAASALIERGARFVAIDFKLHGPDAAADEFPGVRTRLEQAFAADGARREKRQRVEWAVERFLKQFDLPLASTFEGTLGQIHQRTRANLRYYRRMAVRDLGCRFVDGVTVSEREFLELNANSKYAANERLAQWRYRTAGRGGNSFFCGLQAADGRWLSLVGGRRNGDQVEVDWQVNREDLPRYSLSTVMRSFLIEDAVTHGATRLLVEGGTSQPLGASFRYGNVYTVAVRRDGLLLRLASWIADALFPKRRISTGLVGHKREWREAGG